MHSSRPLPSNIDLSHMKPSSTLFALVPGATKWHSPFSSIVRHVVKGREYCADKKNFINLGDSLWTKSGVHDFTSSFTSDREKITATHFLLDCCDAHVTSIDKKAFETIVHEKARFFGNVRKAFYASLGENFPEDTSKVILESGDLTAILGDLGVKNLADVREYVSKVISSSPLDKYIEPQVRKLLDSLSVFTDESKNKKYMQISHSDLVKLCALVRLQKLGGSSNLRNEIQMLEGKRFKNPADEGRLLFLKAVQKQGRDLSDALAKKEVRRLNKGILGSVVSGLATHFDEAMEKRKAASSSAHSASPSVTTPPETTSTATIITTPTDPKKVPQPIPYRGGSAASGFPQGLGSVSAFQQTVSSTSSETAQPSVAHVSVSVPSASTVVVSGPLFTKLEFAKKIDRRDYLESWKRFPDGFTEKWATVDGFSTYLNREYLKNSSQAREQTIRWLFSIVQKCISVAPKNVSELEKHKKLNKLFGRIDYKIRLAFVDFIGKNLEEVTKTFPEAWKNIESSLDAIVEQLAKDLKSLPSPVTAESVRSFSGTSSENALMEKLLSQL